MGVQHAHRLRFLMAEVGNPFLGGLPSLPGLLSTVVVVVVVVEAGAAKYELMASVWSGVTDMISGARVSITSVCRVTWKPEYNPPRHVRCWRSTGTSSGVGVGVGVGVVTSAGVADGVVVVELVAVAALSPSCSSSSGLCWRLLA